MLVTDFVNGNSCPEMSVSLGISVALMAATGICEFIADWPLADWLLADWLLDAGTVFAGGWLALLIRNTPVSTVFPGVEIHANAVSAILNQQLLHKPAWTDAWQLIVLALVMFASLIVMGYATPVLALAGLILILVAIVGLNLYW